MKQILIAGNWKMNTLPDEADNLVQGLIDAHIPESVEMSIFPPFTHLSRVKARLQGTKIRLGAQNMHAESSGAYTGEVSGDMLSAIGCEYVLLGHSERRQLFGESDAAVNQKALKSLEFGLIPIICVGETLEERESGDLHRVITQQIRLGLSGVSSESRFVIAYEPVWAIGTGKVATPEIAQEVHHLIRKLLTESFGSERAAEISILYGGSVKPENASELLKQQDIDGALVGGASLKAADFLGICRASAT